MGKILRFILHIMTRGRERLKLYLSMEMEMLCAVPPVPGTLGTSKVRIYSQDSKDSNAAIFHMMIKIKESFVSHKHFLNVELKQ